jgi:hypothetical protein
MLTISSIALRVAGETMVTIRKTVAQTVQLQCTDGCQLSTRVFLVATNAACIVANAVSAQVPLQPDGSVNSAGAFGGYGNAAWKATLDATAISVGTHKLCADLDGLGNKYGPGATEIYVSVIAATTLA